MSGGVHIASKGNTLAQNRSPSAHSRQIIADLAEVPRIGSLGPIAARFIYSLRLIAIHDRVRRDPIPELATQLASVDAAAKSLALTQGIAMVWPETIHVSRFCCGALTFDEATIGAMIDAGAARDRPAFAVALQGLLRHERIDALWAAVQDLVVAE